jgi:hypothetical protein
MPSTFTQNTGIELIADGEQTGLWGQTTNLNLDIVDRALNGSVNIALSGTTHTLTTSNGELSDGQFAVLVFTGSPSGTNTVTIVPNTAQKTYLVRNTTAQSVVLTQGSGSNVTVPAGRSAAVYADGGGATAAVVDISAGLVPVLTNAGVTATAAELNVLDGVTATTAELNILDGVTATTAELNVLDGVTATTAELNILDGVTATTAELNVLDGVTATTAELNILDGVTATTAELNILDGVTTTTDGLNSVQQFAGRNLIINGFGRINQRGYTSGTATTSANQYTLDRWRVVTSGQNLSFTGTAAGRVMTAPAGGVEQVIEGASIAGGTYVLNWTGTATATVGGSAVAKGGTFTLTANTNATVRMIGGTFSEVQVEAGSIATPFEYLALGPELARCQRYFEDKSWIATSLGGDATYQNLGSWLVRKREVPTVSSSSGSFAAVGTAGFRQTANVTFAGVAVIGDSEL